MNSVQAIYEDGVFRPVTPVMLPEHSLVEFEPRMVEDAPPGPTQGNVSPTLLGLLRFAGAANDLPMVTAARLTPSQTEIQRLLSLRFNSHESSNAAGHCEHQP